MKSVRVFLLGFFFVMTVCLLPSITYAVRLKRGMTTREWEPFGQLREDVYIQTSTFRLVRTQEERRPRDARALGPQDMGPPGIARPELIDSIRRTRKKAYGGGWLWQDVGQTADFNEGWIPMIEEPTDQTHIRKKNGMTITEWWEQKLRGQGQRGGWFRARFGAGTGGVAAGGGGGGGMAPQFQQPSAGGAGIGAGAGVGR